MSINIKSPHEYLNATVVGTPAISEGVVSGFSTSNYIKTPETFNPQSNAWEVIIPVVTSSDVSTTQIFGHISATYSMNFNIISGKFNLVHHQTSVSGSLVLQPNTKYYVKISWDEAKYQLAYSTNGVDYTTDITISSSTGVGTVSMLSFGSNGSNTHFSGSIDLNESYIKINGEYWWKGMELDQYREIKRLYKYDKPRYFKNVTEIAYVDWTQPTLSTDGTVGGASYACRADSEYRTDAATYQAYKAFDKNTGTFWSSSSKTSAWLEFYSPVTIRPTKVTLTNRNGATNPFKNVTVTGSLDGSEYFTLATYTNANSSNSAAWDIVIDNLQTVKYVRVAGSGLVTSNTLSQAEMLVTATQEIVTTSTIEVTANDEYDYIEFNPITIKQVYKTDKTKYYKYLTEYESWTQPVATSNSTAIDGGNMVFSDSYNNSTTAAWKAMNNNNSNNQNCWVNNGTGAAWWQVKFPYVLKITGLKHINASTTGTARNVNGRFYTDSTMTTPIGDAISTPNTNVYETTISGIPSEGILTDTIYFRKTGGGAYGGIGELKITATKPITTSFEVTANDDYDYSELIPTLVYENNSTVFQQSTAGTYTFTVTEEAPYEITLVGGGGGGAFNSSGNAGSAAAGNSGSGLVVNAVLKAGTYVLNVGAGGAWSGWLDANTWGGNGSQSSISKDGVVIATAGGGTGNHCWWRSGSAHNSTVGAAPTYTDALGVRDVILNRQGNWGGLAATSSGGASVISGTTWGKGGDTRNRNAADNGNAGCIKIVRLEK